MFLPLPKLDDRRWQDLVDEGRGLIPSLAPEWSDHNVHDPGITLMELFAWLVEMDLYQLDRIAPSHYRKFLELAGIIPQPPKAARTVLAFEAAPNQEAVDLPASLEFDSAGGAVRVTPFRTLEAITVVPARLNAIFYDDGKNLKDLTARAQAGDVFYAFGLIPRPPAALYFGFTAPLPIGKSVSLYFKLAGGRTDEAEKQKLLRSLNCETPGQDRIVLVTGNETEPKILRHHSVRTVWEFWGESNSWIALRPEAGEVRDATRAFTLDGSVRLRLPQAMKPVSLRPGMRAGFFVRCRCASGDYDAPPQIQKIFINAVAAEQTAPVNHDWKIAPQAQIIGPAPQAGESVAVKFRLNPLGHIDRVEFMPAGDDQFKFLVLDYRAPAPAYAGLLALELILLSRGDGTPGQKFDLPQAPMQQDTLRLFIVENENWQRWILRPDFSASTRSDPHFTLDAVAGKIVFGDGEKGRVVPGGAFVLAAYRFSRHELGNVRSGTITRLALSAHNRALVGDPRQFERNFAGITNPLPAQDGVQMETLPAAQGRAFEIIADQTRAVTLDDIERLVRQTPGARIGRVSAKANLHPDYTCFKAPGMITVIVIPDMPVPQPVPSRGLLRTIARHLESQRVIGTRFEVVGPQYTGIRVQAQVRTLPGAGKARVQTAIVGTLQKFLDPLRGGPDQTGWPFGRDIYRSEILQIIDAVEGVDHVQSLQLFRESGEGQCGNICLSPLGLASSGTHLIEVI